MDRPATAVRGSPAATPPRGRSELGGPTHPQPTPPNAFSTEAPSADDGEQPLQLAPGHRVEQYEIIRELGRGGMGQVFMARDTRLGRVVAIKFLTRTGDAFIRRFLIEAQTTARCTHENIVVIHEANSYLGHPYMVLEYLEGDPLSRIIKGRTLSASRTVEIMVPVVRALTRAHAFGIVHRDLKPDNIFITDGGTVKVLDFGVAKLFGDPDEPMHPKRPHVATPIGDLYETLSTGGRAVGTLPFMSPEQFGADAVDERTDLWAVGILMFRLLSGQHPLPEVTNAALMFAARDLDTPLRSLGELTPTLSNQLIRVVDRCLRKKKAERYATAALLLADLEALLPSRRGRRLDAEESPYPGLLAFEEGDADRFFGRSREIQRAVTALRDNAMLSIVGPSGAGKSSFVRAGLIPELKSSGIAWETFIIRPGRDPLASFAALIEATMPAAAAMAGGMVDPAAIADRLREEPGWLGRVLRDHARGKHTRVLVMVDQYEELYTIAPEADRDAMTRVLGGIADDPGSPLRVVLSLRSDFLHRVAEHGPFASAITRGLLLLGPPDREALREAAVGPAEKADYRFESPAMVDEILAELASSVSPYPLLQFCLSTLWARRDRARHVLPHQAFRDMGGVAGALATHADQVVASLAQGAQRVARTMFQRLVTSDGTRAIVDADELLACGADRAEVKRTLGALVDARLLVLHQDTGTVEIIHEALVAQWPTLRRWTEEGREDTVFVEEVRAASRQWDSKGRSVDLLWRGQAASEARRFVQRFAGNLGTRERDFLAAVDANDRRAARRRGWIVGMIITVLTGLVAASAVALLWIRDAEKAARTEAEKARAAERKVTDQLEMVQRAEDERKAAAEAAERSAEEAAERKQEAEMSRAELEDAYKKIQDALAKAEDARDEAERAATKAEVARKSEQDAKRDLQKALDREKARADKAEERARKIQTTLK
jgi:serine/threonine protein kinase